MTNEQARSKAVELVEKFENEIGHSDLNVLPEMNLSLYAETRELAKQCAMIAVENEQSALDRFAVYWDLKNGEWYKDECDKINQVKSEIEKL